MNGRYAGPPVLPAPSGTFRIPVGRKCRSNFRRCRGMDGMPKNAGAFFGDGHGWRVRRSNFRRYSFTHDRGASKFVVTMKNGSRAMLFLPRHSPRSRAIRSRQRRSARAEFCANRVFTASFFASRENFFLPPPERIAAKFFPLAACLPYTEKVFCTRSCSIDATHERACIFPRVLRRFVSQTA